MEIRVPARGVYLEKTSVACDSFRGLIWSDRGLCEGSFRYTKPGTLAADCRAGRHHKGVDIVLSTATVAGPTAATGDNRALDEQAGGGSGRRRHDRLAGGNPPGET